VEIPVNKTPVRRAAAANGRRILYTKGASRTAEVGKRKTERVRNISARDKRHETTG